MLESVEIHRFKKLQKISETFDRVTVLVGTNGSGKNSILQAIHSAVALAQSRLRLPDQTGMNSEEAAFTISPQDALYLPLVEPGWLAPRGGLTQSSGPIIAMTLAGSPPTTGSVGIKRGKNRNLAVKLKGRSLISRIEQLANPFSVYVPGLAGIAKNEVSIGFGNLLRAVARGDANLVLRNVLNALRTNAHKWQKFQRDLQVIFPGQKVVVDFNVLADEYINVVVRRGEEDVPLDCAGTSFLQTLQILSYIHLFNPVVTLLDEPDSHLHPNNQRALAELLWALADQRQTQVVLATHSRHIIDVLRDKVGVKFLWCRNGSTQAVGTHVELLTDLGALDSAEGLLAGGVKFVVLAEDKKKGLLKTLLASHGFNERDYQVWSYKGCSKLDVAHALASFIHEVSATTKIIVHRDSDYLREDDIKRIRGDFQRIGLSLFCTPGVDLEGLYCRLDHLKMLNPEHEDRLDRLHRQALTESEADLRRAARDGANEVDNQRHKAGVPTIGKAASDDWAQGLDLTSERWIHGKILLPVLRKFFQTETGNNLKVEVPSPHLKVPELDDLLSRIQPPPASVQAPPATQPSIV
jgi:predicted ATPase